VTQAISLNPEMIKALSTSFPLLSAPATSWGNVLSNHLLLRHLRGYWPMTSVDENGDVYDLSGQGRVLNNNNAVPFVSAGLMTYADLTAATPHYFNRVDEAGLDILGGLTLGGWFWLDTLATGQSQGLISKWDTSGGANQRAFLLYLDDATNTLRFFISSLGTAASSVSVTSTATIAINSWYYVVGRFVPGTEISIFVNGVETVVAAAIPAALFNSSADLEVGSYNIATNPMDGRASHCFLCADDLEDYFIKALFWHSCPLVGVKP